jgi:RNA polymerase sigma-54 factor
MKLEMTPIMRMEQQMKLAPHMIQSMEILQLPILALQSRIEQELHNNPVLEVDEPSAPETTPGETETEQPELPDSAVPGDKVVDNFEQVDSLDYDYRDYMDRAGTYARRASTDEPDAKLEAIKNTEAPPKSMHEYLSEQWHLVEADEPVKKAGQKIVDYINDRGYLSVRLEQLHNKDRKDFTYEDLQKALSLVQKLEPLGVGARDLKECLLIQMAQSDEDMSFEMQLIGEHLEELLENHLPDIAQKMDCTIEDINQAVARVSKFDTSPGLQLDSHRNHNISPDVIVEPDESPLGYSVRLANWNLPSLRISDYYSTMARDASLTTDTKKFLQTNIRSAQWIIDAIEQRKNTMLRVARSIVRFQREFFDKGSLHLRPLPMATIADDVGVHLATVSRAVAGKYIQCEWGILPLRKFFSGGTEDENGTGHSWEAIRGKLQQIIDAEDKTKPLCDELIKEELAKTGIKNVARRTVAKYRGLLNIPAARYRKKY